ncbi:MULTISPECIES: hypothetical protein [unclassified Streptomyces]|uniref:hypothetical protein n=1 Tax=unclassified Streptomyces TaxID=2593676 RepID=UPI00336A478A
MKIGSPGFWVAAGWGLGNALLIAVLAGYGENSLTYWLWGSAVVLIEGTALAVLISSRGGSEEQLDYRAPATGGGAALPAAAGLAALALAFVYGWWLLSLGIPLLGVGLTVAIRARLTRTR